MILFPNAKINIGLDILNKRADGFHNIETIFFPIELCDILEINKSDKFIYSQSGIPIEGDIEDNLIVKAYRLLQKRYNLSAVHIHLHKQIPFGAGLGGGSSDAAYALKGLNTLFELDINKRELLDYAAMLGSDCPFFIINQPVFAEGRGEVLQSINISLEGLTLVLIKPNCSVSTAEAYANIKPLVPSKKLLERICYSIEEWPEQINNQFEKSVFPFFYEIEEIKNMLYKKGAVYSSMSGSGSSVFGLFKSEPIDIENDFKDCFVYKEKINPNKE